MRQFTILNLLTVVALVAALLSWIPASRPPELPDGYVWSHLLLACEYPPTPADYPKGSIRYADANQEFANGSELYRYYFYQGWWICRRNFVEEKDGYPFDESDWDYLKSAQSAPDDDFGKFPQMAMRDGCRACSRQIEELLEDYTPDELRDQLIHSAAERYWVPILMTILAAVFLTAKSVSRRNSNGG